MKEFSFHYLTALLALGCCLPGCATPRERHIVIAIDVSDAEQSRLLRYVDLAFKCQRRFATFTCIVYAADADVVYEGKSIQNRSRFNEAIGGILARPRIGLRSSGTNHQSALALAGQMIVNEKSVMLLLTDGGEENHASGIAKGMEQLSSAPEVYIFGVLPEHRGALLGSFGGRSVLIRSLADADPGIVGDAR